jgi:hypothetical protein
MRYGSIKHLCTALLVFLTCVVVAAQEPVINPDASVDSATLHQWLQSKNPRLIAWAATFARRNHDAKILAEMPEWLESWPMPSAYDQATWPAQQQRALAARPALAVLDALIQEDGQVPISAINAITAAFPTQAAILISRHPLSESRDTLDLWMLYGDPISIRLSTMLFAKDPSQRAVHWGRDSEFGFVAGIVADAEAEVRISVAADSARRPLTGGAACGDSGGRQIAPGWPEVFAYELVENDPHANGPLIVDVGGDRMATRRYPENGGGGTCFYPQRLDARTRHRLIAYWLGIQPQDMTWQPVEPFTIRWTGQAAYQRQLGKIVESERQKLSATVDSLRQTGVLTGPGAAPKLIVTIQCEMKPCPLQ